MLDASPKLNDSDNSLLWKMCRTLSVSSEELLMQGNVNGRRIINQYGRNGDVDAAEDIWSGGGDYTGFPTSTPELLEVLSSDAADTAAGTGARTLRVFYFNADFQLFDANEEPLYVDVTLNGTTPVSTGVVVSRVWRAEVLTSGSGTTNAGVITGRWTSTTSAVFFAIRAGFAQSELSSFTIPAGWTGYLRQYTASLEDSGNLNHALVCIRARKPNSNTFRFIRVFALRTTFDIERNIYGGEKFLEKTDFMFRALSISNSNGQINVTYGVLLVKN